MGSAAHNEPARGGQAGDLAVSAGTEQRMCEIAGLLKAMDEGAAASGRSASAPTRHENQLVQVRLGLASSLFVALRCKHMASAAHCLRVALGCSAWSLSMDMTDAERDQLEVAALLHDLGKIGVPDHVLQKPGELNPNEAAVMSEHMAMCLEILNSCGAPPGLLETVRYSSAWYDGSRGQFDRSGKDLPLGARILSIVDAFDSMTTDQVYRRAMSRERALAELYEHAGTQFDPELVDHFRRVYEISPLDIQAKVSQRWLAALMPDSADQTWHLNPSPATRHSRSTPQTMFQQKLLDNMHDGVVFVDSQMQIFLWNQGAQRLTGISGSATFQRQFLPSLVQLRDERGNVIADNECPVASSVRSGVQSLRRLTIRGRGGKDSPVDFHAIPVLGQDGTAYGATLLMHDASSETSLEERCQRLHSQATKDPLTQVANRAEFDRVHASFIQAHTESNLPCSLIICDIDHFKSVNDNYGHQAGDEAIRNFARLLKSMCRHGDLAARYGGEEFVLLCADCDNATASQRAEQLRRALADMPQPMLNGRRITASFGVTQHQAGDTPETMLRRADRALLQAKAAGRNRTMQLGTGSAETASQRRRWSWWPFGLSKPDALIEMMLATNVPLEVAIEKLRGFVADHDAHITKMGDDHLHLMIEGEKLAMMRRRSDRPVPFLVELTFSQTRVPNVSAQGVPQGESLQTRVAVTIRPKRDRDRRRNHAADRAGRLVHSLRSYLMASEVV